MVAERSESDGASDETIVHRATDGLQTLCESAGIDASLPACHDHLPAPAPPAAAARLRHPLLPPPPPSRGPWTLTMTLTRSPST